MIYFDNNATTRVFDCVLDAMLPFFTDRYANSSSAIAQFCGIPQTLNLAKARICKALGVETTDQLLITSGATESNNLSIFGAAKANPQRRHIIASAIEHPSVLEIIEALRTNGYRISLLPTNSDGVVELDALAGLLASDTLLVSVMSANNETGVIQPVSELAKIVKETNPSVLFHTDATQAVGKIEINLSGDLSCVDLLSFSAHKFHGPKGTGALYIRNMDQVSPLFYGGGQQAGMRPGTENPAGVVGMAAAIAKVLTFSCAPKTMLELRARIEKGVFDIHPSAFVLGAAVERLPSTTNICLPGIQAEALVDQLAVQGIAISTGSACSYGAQSPSHVAIAQGLSYEKAKSCVRLSLSVESTENEVNLFLEAFPKALSVLATNSNVSKEVFS